MRRLSAPLLLMLACMALASCAMEQRRLPYASTLPRTGKQDGISEYRVEGNVRDFIRPYLTVELPRRGPSPQPSVSGWVSLTRNDGEEAVRAPMQLQWLSVSKDKTHADRLLDRYGARLELGFAFHPRTIWQKGAPVAVEEPLSATVFLHTASDQFDGAEKVAIEGGMYRSDVKRWIAAGRAREAHPKNGSLVYDPATKREPANTTPEQEKKG